MRPSNQRWRAGLTALAASAVLVALAGTAHAGVEAWRINEVSADPRFIELYAPPSMDADNCFFPTTRLELLDGAGVVRATLQPFNSTTCFGGDTYFLFAPAGGDAALPYPLDPAGGQVCFRSTTIRYDCVRWGSVSVAVGDQGAPDDGTSAPALPPGQALARFGDTDVVGADFVLQAPTPRGPNDGTPWTPPDAGPLPPDAAPFPDGAPPIDASADARILPEVPDARAEPPAFLNAQPGGAGCGCSVGGRGAPRGAWLLAAAGGLGLLLERRQELRRRQRP